MKNKIILIAGGLVFLGCVFLAVSLYVLQTKEHRFTEEQEIKKTEEREAGAEEERTKEEERIANLEDCLASAEDDEEATIKFLENQRVETCTKGTSAYVVEGCSEHVDELIKGAAEDRERDERNCFLRFGD